MSQEHDLAEMDAVTLVDAAIEDRVSFKKVGLRLDDLVPDEQAAKHLIAAFHRHRCEPWLTAYLLGCNGHHVGYETAKTILLSNAGSSSESYAGVAMAKILGLAAYDDLRQIIFGDHPQKVREGAVYGLVDNSSPQLLNDLFTAFKEQRLSRSGVGSNIAKCNPTDDWLLEQLHSENVQVQKLACAIIDFMLRPNLTSRIPGNQVANSVQDLLNDQEFSIMQSRRENLLAWINSTS
ncbi:MAG: hypothetical protein COA78_22960 [Blastopirellula sp.]|nr:MAG: hypothetical protein COA78_22960 [Blastopirellula sp.]